ncbi:MAG: hypothetical protein KDI36_07430 [Pseudomonadales bacterium]|nr:hypothetical protein [Pseudomonadales bacterium]
MMKWEIYLDVDGVCADFIGPALTAVGLDSALIQQQWAEQYPGNFYPDELLGMSAAELFRRIDALGAGFCATLPACNWFPSLYHELSTLGHVVFLTAPTGYPDCLAGKYQWLCRFFGEGFRDCVFTEHKERLAHPDAILIDDSDNNIRNFIQRGGYGVSFPQYWNQRGSSADPLQDVLEDVRQIVGAAHQN